MKRLVKTKETGLQPEYWHAEDTSNASLNHSLTLGQYAA